LRAVGARVRFNFPYKGTSDGLTSSMWARVPPEHYAGLEIEINQATLRDATRRRALRVGLAAGFRCLAPVAALPGPRRGGRKAVGKAPS